MASEIMENYMTNLEKYKSDLSRLISQGDALYEAICNECEHIDRRKQNENLRLNQNYVQVP